MKTKSKIYNDNEVYFDLYSYIIIVKCSQYSVWKEV